MFAKNLKRARKARGFTQEQLAEAANMHINYVGSVERGERNLSLRNIERLADALDVTMAFLVSPESALPTAPVPRKTQQPADIKEDS